MGEKPSTLDRIPAFINRSFTPLLKILRQVAPGAMTAITVTTVVALIDMFLSMLMVPRLVISIYVMVL